MLKTSLKKSLLSVAIISAAISLAACNDKEVVTETVEPEATTEVVVEPEAMPETEVVAETDPMATEATQSIAEMAAGNEKLTILTAALKAAGLDTMMMDAGTYTVFAPTDDAFAAVLTKLNVTKEELLANTDLLKTVLPYHVVPIISSRSSTMPKFSRFSTPLGFLLSKLLPSNPVCHQPSGAGYSNNATNFLPALTLACGATGAATSTKSSASTT